MATMLRKQRVLRAIARIAAPTTLMHGDLDRLDGLVPEAGQFICAGQTHRDGILGAVVPSSPDRYLSEPTGRAKRCPCRRLRQIILKSFQEIEQSFEKDVA